VIRERTDCRLCSARVRPVFALSPTPIANNYRPHPDASADRYPLELSQCESCGHVQLRHVITGLFDDYKYVTPSAVSTHLLPRAQRLREEYPNAERVLEIGSNNGLNLLCLRAQGFDAYGIDPAATGDYNEVGYFSAAWAESRLVDETYDLIVANNVLAHIDDLHGVFDGIEMLLAVDGALIFEVQSFAALVAMRAFDMIYHEHLDYHTIDPLKEFIRRRGLVMTACERIPTHGGSLRVTVRTSGEWTKETDAPTDWSGFADGVNGTKSRVRETLRGRKVVALGAAAKATTLIHHCGIADHILYACDDTPEKQFRYIPGTDIQILPSVNLSGHPAFLTAWNYEKEFRAKYPNNEIINPFAETVCA
jgi:SAM-dependent methyltransferase